MAEMTTMTRATEAITGERVRLRAVDPDDVDRLTDILHEDEIRRWWGLYDQERVRAEFLDQGLGMYVIEADAQPVGAIEWVEATDPDYRHAEIDLFVTSNKWNQGIGTEAVKLLCRHLFEGAGHHRIVAAPGTSNERAIAFFKDAGFREVGVLHQYERQPSGSWQDCLLLELLRDDFRA